MSTNYGVMADECSKCGVKGKIIIIEDDGLETIAHIYKCPKCGLSWTVE